MDKTIVIFIAVTLILFGIAVLPFAIIAGCKQYGTKPLLHTLGIILFNFFAVILATVFVSILSYYFVHSSFGMLCILWLFIFIIASFFCKLLHKLFV